MHTIKRHTALQANKLLYRTGAPFWQHEYYDHWIRNQDEFEKPAATSNETRSFEVLQAISFSYVEGDGCVGRMLNPLAYAIGAL